MLSLPISKSFKRKKDRILHDLAVPALEYTDASPKGSIDKEIRDLVDFVNTLEGYVTTSSCAGRISVFAEGQKNVRTNRDSSHTTGPQSETATIGGKGGGGRWLFVSHNPVDLQQALSDELSTFQNFNDTQCGCFPASEPQHARFVRFAFEPMILHVMAASLHHARPLLSAAINAGFRESGVQSLKNLDDPEVCPMVAVRTAGGPSLQSIIGFVTNDDRGIDMYQSILSNNQLTTLFEAANARFDSNKQMITNFQRCLNDAMELEAMRASKNHHWEDSLTRKMRKRQEGLAERNLTKRSMKDQDTTNDVLESTFFSLDQ